MHDSTSRGHRLRGSPPRSLPSSLALPHPLRNLGFRHCWRASRLELSPQPGLFCPCGTTRYLKHSDPLRFGALGQLAATFPARSGSPGAESTAQLLCGPSIQASERRTQAPQSMAARPMNEHPATSRPVTVPLETLPELSARRAIGFSWGEKHLEEMEKTVRNIYSSLFTAPTTGMYWSHVGQSSERKVLDLGHKRRLFALLLP